MLSEHKAKRLSELAISPTRIVFDHLKTSLIKGLWSYELKLVCQITSCLMEKTSRASTFAEKPKLTPYGKRCQLVYSNTSDYNLIIPLLSFSLIVWNTGCPWRLGFLRGQSQYDQRRDIGYHFVHAVRYILGQERQSRIGRGDCFHNSKEKGGKKYPFGFPLPEDQHSERQEPIPGHRGVEARRGRHYKNQPS